MRRDVSAGAARRESSSGPAARREGSARPAAVRSSSAQRRLAAAPPRPTPRLAADTSAASPGNASPALASRHSPEAQQGYPASGHGKPSGRAPAVPSSGSSARASSSGRAAASVRSSSASRSSSTSQAPITCYLRVYGLHQYARSFVEGGFAELGMVAKLSETEALDIVERLRVHPGHRLRLLRALDCLRQAAAASGRKDAAQELEDAAAFEKLSAERDQSAIAMQLRGEKETAEEENKKLQEETSRLLGVMQQQDVQLRKARDRIAELEELVQSQTDQVRFLAGQLQNVAHENPQKQEQLYKSYRDSHDARCDSLDGSDWGTGEAIDLPDAMPKNGGALDLSKPGAFSAADFSPLLEKARIQDHADVAASQPRPPPAVPTRPPPPVSAPFTAKAQLARSLDSAQIRESLSGFDVDNVIKCLAIAVQNKIILTVGKPRPHTNGASNLEACSIFLEPVCRDRLTADGGGSAAGMLDTLGKPVHPLNSIVVRNAPNKWDVYGFLRDVMANFRLQPEVSVITLVYLDRFTDLSGVAITPDNWQRLTITAMMLGSKVWDDESFENAEFSQLCPLYTIDEINTFERVFLKCVGYNMACRGSQYAKTYFLLRTLGAKDSANFGLEPMDPIRASRLTERCLEKQIEFKDRYPDDVGSSNLNWTM